MDATALAPPSKRLPFLLQLPVVPMQNRRRHRFVRSVLSRNTSADAPSIDRSENGYDDSWFDRLAISHISQALQASAGVRSSKRGYDSLLETATVMSRRFNPIQRRQLVLRALHIAFPQPILSLIKALLPESKFARECSAVFTTVFFAWLVGPCQVRGAEFQGRQEKNVVHIPRCRFLEGTGCVGMCTNLCKMPCQSFIKESLGIPINMVPNFDEMSCEIRFGEEPPPQPLDPAFKQPCYMHCKVMQKHWASCID